MRKKVKTPPPPVRRIFQFEQGFNVGGITAESDPLLESCFLTTKHYELIADINSPHFALIGRSGTGKSAIIERISSEFEHVIRIKPETLAFQFLGSSEMVSNLRKHNINLDYFYKLLWRHVFVVEILKHFFPEEARRVSLIRQLLERVQVKAKRDRERDRAISYLDQWGASLLQAPQERVQNIHDSLEKSIKAKIGLKGGWAQLLDIGSDVEGVISSQKDVDERIRIIQEVVSKIQIEDLNAARDYLGSAALRDPQKPCFILIDDLDRYFTDDSIYFELIRALILEAYDWSKVKNVKIIYALRDNILHKVESNFTSKSYQREKFEDHRIHLSWVGKELKDLIDVRLKKITADRKLANIPTFKTILPLKVGQNPDGVTFVLARTLQRPRDVIDFINKAGKRSIGRNKISWSVLNRVEETYSQGRLNALLDEWRDNCEGLDILLKLIRNGPVRFPLGWWSENDIIDLMVDERMSKKGWCSNLVNKFNTISQDSPEKAVIQCRKDILQILYEVGIVGVKISKEGHLKFSYKDTPTLPDYELEQIQNPQVVVHPCFRLALATQTI